jgi:hypothetical protein
MMSPSDWEEFKRQWAVDGMPKDKQRLAEAAFLCGAKNKSETLDKLRIIEIYLDDALSLLDKR